MVLVAVVLGAFGLLMVTGLVLLYLKMGSLADELRDAREADALSLSIQLDSIADKQQGTRLDLHRMDGDIRTGNERIAELALHIEGPPSLRHPTLSPPSGAASAKRAAAISVK